MMNINTTLPTRRRSSRRPYVWTKQEVEKDPPPSSDTPPWGTPPDPPAPIRQTVWILVRSANQEIAGVVHETRLVTGPKIWRGVALHAVWEKFFLEAADAKRAMLRAFLEAEGARGAGVTVVPPPPPSVLYEPPEAA